MAATSEKEIWAAAGSLNDLCALTERWLRADLATQPGYSGSVDVDEDEAPGLTDACIALNRIGFLTRNSQAGFEGTGYDGARWTQLAAVDGITTPPAAFALRRNLPQGFKIHTGRWVDVTLREGQFATRFGGDNIDPDEFHMCSREAITDAMTNGVPFIVYDPTAGPNTLWAAITRACAATTL
jgi:hypothetical protein